MKLQQTSGHEKVGQGGLLQARVQFGKTISDQLDLGDAKSSVLTAVSQNFGRTITWAHLVGNRVGRIVQTSLRDFLVQLGSEKIPVEQQEAVQGKRCGRVWRKFRRVLTVALKIHVNYVSMGDEKEGNVMVQQYQGGRRVTCR